MAWPVSERYQRAITAPYEPAQNVEITRNGLTVATGLRIVGGNVQATATADVRRTVKCTVVGVPRALVPTLKQRSPLDIYGNELVIQAGVRWYDGVELIPQGVYEIVDSDLVDNAGGVQVALAGSDRSARVADASLTSPWMTATGTSAVAAISALAEARYPGLTVVDATSAADTFPPHVLEEDTNPWADGIRVFARAVGAEAYFDRLGRLLVRDVPDTASQPAAWEYAEGPRCTVTELGRQFSRSLGGANAVVVKGENSSNSPVKGSAVDTDPQSPTYYGPSIDSPAKGGYGPRPVFVSSPLVTTTEQATRMASGMLRQLAGATELVRIVAVPNHAIDPGDVVNVLRERSGFRDAMVVDSVDLPLSTDGLMTLTCRARRTGGS